MSEPVRKDAGASRQPGNGADGRASILTLVAMLASSATIQLGLVENPITKKPQKDLRAARHTIDLLAVLEEKTRGNLSQEERQVLGQVLADLRVRFVDASK
ncbi:MAG TPA: DUF1844 domain-containing protein [Planctomycetota bacterium]|nr:DUF1844 domain-containing protein [Planctomycetota bacterium]